MFQAYLDGVRGGEGTLVIRDMKACPYCRGDIKVLARAMKLDALTVHDGDGKVIAFSTPDDFLPVRQGGKRWR